jgi:hypothetical protein
MDLPRDWRRRWVGPVVVPLLLAVAVAGCGEPADYSVPPERPTCAGAPTTVDLGGLYGHSNIALFTTKGGVVHFEVSGINQGGIFAMNRTFVILGPAWARPTYPDQGLDGTVWTRVRVNDRSYGSVILPAGSYWVGSSSGGHVLATSCLPGGVTPAS